MAGKSLKELQKRVKAPKPLRVLINAAATAAWYDIGEDEMKSQVIERLLSVCHNWRQMKGVRFIASFDDDLFMAGDPRGFQKWSIYMLFEVEKLESVVTMVDDFRQGDPKLHTYFTLQATLGRAFWPIEVEKGSK
jgi:hypothetical protein